MLAVDKLRRAFAALLLAACVGATVFELFDRALDDGNDTEPVVVVVALCAGAGFIAATTFVTRIRPSWTIGVFITRQLSASGSSLDRRQFASFFDASSPPTPLRV